MTTADLQEIKDLIAKELREAGLLNEPQQCLLPPASVNHERVVIGALLCGEAKIADLPIKKHHFFLPLARELFARVEVSGPAGFTADYIEKLAPDDHFLQQNITDLMGQAWCSPSQVQASCAVIIEMWQRRRLCKLLERVVGNLKTDNCTYAEAVASLGAYLGGTGEL